SRPRASAERTLSAEPRAPQREAPPSLTEIAPLFAAYHPERLRSLTLTNGDTHDNWPPEPFKSTLAAAASGQLEGRAPRHARRRDLRPLRRLRQRLRPAGDAGARDGGGLSRPACRYARGIPRFRALPFDVRLRADGRRLRSPASARGADARHVGN